VKEGEREITEGRSAASNARAKNARVRMPGRAGAREKGKKRACREESSA
jgi:hypothetical protein